MTCTIVFPFPSAVDYCMKYHFGEYRIWGYVAIGVAALVTVLICYYMESNAVPGEDI